MIDRILLAAAWIGFACFVTHGLMFMFSQSQVHAWGSLVGIGLWVAAGAMLIRRRMDSEASNG